MTNNLQTNLEKEKEGILLQLNDKWYSQELYLSGFIQTFNRATTKNSFNLPFPHMELDLINFCVSPVNMALDTLDTKAVIEFQLH